MATCRLNEQQLFAHQVIMEGHNLVLTGQAGAGKSFVVRDTIELMKFSEIRYGLLCTTGIACLQYFDYGATTVHSWAGLYDGRYDNVTLKDLVLKDDKYAKVRENVGKCDVIIIDEVSMLSKKDFEQLEMVCRVVKGNGLIFGGIQLVVCGDFYQLPPVPNAMYNDSEEYCFESELWPLVFNHRINLDVIVRQSEPNLIKAVRETAIGKVSDETDKFLKSLNRDLPDDIEPTHLFARNIDADLYNNEKLGELKTPGKVYIAPKNIGPKRRLNKILAPQKLSLKIDCPVILLRNLGGKLVNGLRGRVKELNDNYITVYFEKIKETHKIERYTFTQYDINKKMNIAERLQFPLRLAYGLTIHKSQGLTLDSVYIHCGGIFQCGQFSVALGRARTSDTVQLENYHKGLCQQPKSAVTKFYGIQSEAFEFEIEDCCPKKKNDKMKITEEICANQNDSDDSEFEDNELEALENIDISSIPLLPSTFDTNEILKSLICHHPVTDQHRKCNDICFSISKDFLEIFLAKQYDIIKCFLDENMSAEQTSPRIWTSVFNKYHLYITSEDFKSYVPLLYGYETALSDDQRYVAVQLTFKLLQAIISAESAKVVSQNSEEIRKGALSDAGKAKIRYVGGMCIAKCRAHICNIIKEKLGDPREDAQPKLHTAKKHLEFLYSLDASLEEKENACSDNSFEEIERKQNVTKCLTYINEKCYTFFLLLNTKVSEIMTTDAFEKEKESLFGKCFTFLLHDEELKSIWAELCQKIIKIDVSMYIFENIVKRYLKVNQKQFLKDTKSYLNVKKKKSHREEIKSKSVNKKTDEKLNMQSIETDNSVNKERSHLRLKLNCLENDNFLARTAFLKKDLTKLCDAYNVKYSQNMKKDTLAMTLREKILQSEHMINCDIFQQPMCSASQEPPPKKPKRSKSKSKKKSVRKRKSLETEYFCGKCGIVYNDGEEWIQCDICESWYHRACTDLQNDEDWEHVQDSEVDWTCDQCN